MKRLVLLCALLLVIGSVAAEAAVAKPKPKATGGVTASTATQTFTAQFSAKANPKGGFNIVYTAGSLGGEFYVGEVTCYTQTGNLAIFGGPVTDTNNLAGISFIRITVQDNGEGAKASGPDQIQVQRFVNPPPVASQCNTPDPLEFATVTSGNLQVH